MVVLGLDPSKTSCGWAVFDGRRIVAGGAEQCRHRQAQGVKGIEAAYSGAVNLWAAGLAERIFEEHQPIAVAIEEPLAHTKDGATGKHVLAVVFSGLASVPVSRGVRVYSVPQGTWRKGIGVNQSRGSNTKAEAMRLCRLFDGSAPPTHDEAEARLIARWLAAQIKLTAGHETLPLMAAGGAR